MLVFLRSHNVGVTGEPLTIIAVDPWKIDYVRPIPLEPDVCYVSIGTTSWRVDSAFYDLVDKINEARKENTK